MAIIGTFVKNEHGLSGVISTLVLNAKLQLIPVIGAHSGDNMPAFRIMAAAVEIGAAWKKVSRADHEEYLSCTIDDPSFGEPIHASLVEAGNDSGNYLLIWSRRPKT